MISRIKIHEFMAMADTLNENKPTYLRSML